jgi:hypothetical protein
MTKTIIRLYFFRKYDKTRPNFSINSDNIQPFSDQKLSNIRDLLQKIRFYGLVLLQIFLFLRLVLLQKDV